ncbi:MAG TPA: PEGA domain-containing protein, partial [Myxococcales bacterium]|nr:PEGA domain-containing protein [Myxococcales bacterium]
DPERTEEVPPGAPPGYMGGDQPKTFSPAEVARVLGAGPRGESGETAAFSGTTTSSGAPFAAGGGAKSRAAKKAGSGPGVPILPISAVVAALVLLGGATYWALRPRATPGDAIIHIRSEPDGATVLFNGRPLADPTPCDLPRSPPGQFPLVVGKRGYLDLHATVTIPETGEITLGPLRLERDKNQAGATPGPGPGPSSGPVAEADGGPGESAAPDAAKVELSLRSEPSGAAISLDGSPSGRTPRTFLVLAGADVSVRLEYPGYATLSEQVRVGQGPTQEELLRLDRLGPTNKVQKGKVRFAVTPWANVSCGSYDLGATPFADKELPVGVYQCRFTHPEHGTRTERVEVKANSVIKVSVKF